MDYDNNPREEFSQRLDDLYKRVDERESSRFCIFYPVKSIEHWLFILKKKIENPALNKNITNEVESTPNKEMKKVFYGNKFISKEEKEKSIFSIMAQANLEWLAERSFSFSLFYSKLKTIIM